MIVVRVQGGMGNQMFQYAFALATSLRLKTDLHIDTSLLGIITGNYTQVMRGYELGIFSLPQRFAGPALIRKYNFTGSESKLLQFLLKVRYKLLPPNNLIQKEHRFLPEYLQAENNTCLIGRWQSEKFFENHRAEVKQAFILKNPLSALEKAKDALKDSMYCVVHIRRGDYVSNAFYSAQLGALPIEYYHSAMAFIAEKHPGITFLIFSNEYEWCKKQEWRLPVEYACDLFSFSDAVSEFYLMSHIPHHIISNSTFSWWAAWLAESPGSYIAGPEVWAKTSAFTPENILPDRWKKIHHTFQVTK
jgi:hypothetical protein